MSRCTTGINDTGGKFATNTTSIVDNGGKFATGVSDTGGKYWVHYQTADTLTWRKIARLNLFKKMEVYEAW